MKKTSAEVVQQGSLTDLGSKADPKATADFYDKWADSYDKDLIAWDYQAPGRIASLCEKHGIQKGGAIADIGCGTGMSGESLATLGFTNIHGGDLSPAQIEFLKQCKAHVYKSAHVMNMEEVPYPLERSQFDAVTCVGTLTYFKGVETFKTVFGEFISLLRPGGLALFTMREDLLLKEEVGMREAKDFLEKAGQWTCVYESEPESYLPKCPTEAGSFRIRSFVMKKNSQAIAKRRVALPVVAILFVLYKIYQQMRSKGRKLPLFDKVLAFVKTFLR
jgi:SAM-dependent methyltransferase